MRLSKNLIVGGKNLKKYGKNFNVDCIGKLKQGTILKQL